MMRIACYVTCPVTLWQTKEALEGAGFECKQFHSLTDMFLSLRGESFDLILVDVEDSDQSLLYAWMGCRNDQMAPMVLMFSPAFQAVDIANALDAGADEVIRRPVAPIEIVARIKAVLLRNHKAGAQQIQLLGYSLNRGTCMVTDCGAPVKLTPREFAVAWIFFSSPSTYLSRKSISAAVWGVDATIANRSLEQHIYVLRKKLKLSLNRGAIIRGVYNKGYRLEVDGGSEVVARESRPRRERRTVPRVAEVL